MNTVIHRRLARFGASTHGHVLFLGLVVAGLWVGMRVLGGFTAHGWLAGAGWLAEVCIAFGVPQGFAVVAWIVADLVQPGIGHPVTSDGPSFILAVLLWGMSLGIAAVFGAPVHLGAWFGPPGAGTVAVIWRDIAYGLPGMILAAGYTLWIELLAGRPGPVWSSKLPREYGGE